jgi:Mg-chelatase subunit ChlD
LLTVSNKASVKQELTPVFESFRQQLDKVTAGGDTAIYDALDAARRMLVNYRSDLPKLRKRIVIVTDGIDTSSETSAKDACHALQRDNIIVDSVQVGHQSDNKLHGISVATGRKLFSVSVCGFL